MMVAVRALWVEMEVSEMENEKRSWLFELVARGIWVTERGEEVEVAEMSDWHISACIKKLQSMRNGFGYDMELVDAQMQMFEDEVVRRFELSREALFGTSGTSGGERNEN